MRPIAHPKESRRVKKYRELYTVEKMFEDMWRSRAFESKAPATKRGYLYNANVLKRDYPDIYFELANKITRSRARDLHERIWDEKGLPMAYACLAVLRLAFSHALDRDRGDISINPCVALRLRLPKPRLRCATQQEISVLVEAADSVEPSIGDAIIIALFTGQRQSDVLALTVDSVRSGRIILQQRKAATPMSIHVVPALESRLEIIRKRNAKAGLNAVALVCKQDGSHWNQDTFRHAYAAIRNEAAKTLPSLADLRFQDLRDTSVTWLARSGCTIPEIASVTGHALESIHTTMKHYLIIDETMNNSAMAKFAEMTNGFAL
jgi:integrase